MRRRHFKQRQGDKGYGVLAYGWRVSAETKRKRGVRREG